MNFSELENIVGKDNVISDADILSGYGKDYSLAPAQAPAGAVSPGNIDELKAIVKWANQSSVPLVPVSSGEPRFRGDTIPTTANAVVVDLGRMNRIIRINALNRVALVEPGVTFGELQEALAKEGLSAYLPLLPRSTKSVLTSELERDPITMPCIHFDSTDPMLCAEIVFGNGASMRTGEAAGPDTLEQQWEIGKAQISPFGPTQMDPQRLVSGAQGTIGIVTWISIKCRFLSELSRAFFIPSATIEPLIELSYRLTKIRFTGSIFIVNSLNLACLNRMNPVEIAQNAKATDDWIMFVSCEGYGPLPDEKVSYLEADLRELASAKDLSLITETAGINADAFAGLLLKPSPEPYWKQRLKGGVAELFFLTTQGKVPKYIRLMETVSHKQNYPLENVGVYVQPTVMGTSCHCEFDVYYDPTSQAETNAARQFTMELADQLEKEGAFFSRPYRPWTDIAYRRHEDTVNMQRKVKDIFDPNGILNPGHLCFG